MPDALVIGLFIAAMLIFAGLIVSVFCHMFRRIYRDQDDEDIHG